jgi:hypothetical protein
MYKKLIFIVLIISLSINVFAQAEIEKEHNFSIGASFVQTMNSGSWYSGLRGVNTSFDYEFVKQSKKYSNNFWGIFTEGDYNFLLNNKLEKYLGNYSPDFYRIELTFGGKWFWRLPQFIKNLNIYAGTGLSINGEFNYYNYIDIMSFINYPDFNWYISSDLHIRVEYNLKKINLKGEIFLPAAMLGNYSDQFHAYPVHLDTASIVKYKLTPNTFTLLHRIFQPTIKLSAMFPLKKSERNRKQWYFQVKYVFENLDVNLKNYIEKKEQHTLRFGFVCR